MKSRLIGCAGILAALAATDAAAQVDVGLAPAAVVSFQPIDDAYVGGPYLSEGVGGIAPGFGAGASVILSSGVAIAAEYTTAFYEQEHSGRAVLGGFPLESVLATTKLRDSYLSVLVGYATSGTTRLVFLGGVSARLGHTTINGRDAEEFLPDEVNTWPITGGLDVVRPLNGRAQLVVGGRYTYNERAPRLEQLGIGPHVIRGSAGVRIRFN